ncbi:hypothetical protein D9611_007429 [Ephemerocybe angulata]|uniref:Uncharacterized protein n=1 Tax=Ephemerocybe angulata TaxID=980116 RepID=A0A8H5CF09_9AGAR|nr:hypothetical protein D9611_007429 [Tulosesus angulatus]
MSPPSNFILQLRLHPPSIPPPILTGNPHPHQPHPTPTIPPETPSLISPYPAKDAAYLASIKSPTERQNLEARYTWIQSNPEMHGLAIQWKTMRELHEMGMGGSWLVMENRAFRGELVVREDLASRRRAFEALNLFE